MPRLGRLAAIAAVAGVPLLAACQGQAVTSPPIGHAVIRARSASLAAGDTMTVQAGVLYNNGTFRPFTGESYMLLDTTFASLDTATRLLRGKSAGSAPVRVTVPHVGMVDSTFTIVAAR